MQRTLHKIQLPIIENFSAEYYFHNSAEKYSPKVFPPHVHDTIEFYVLIDGNVSFLVENVIYKMQKGVIIRHLLLPQFVHIL